ncbi:MAG: pirin family protein [Bacteroidia bacterium]|nr:pirin family protein [Bacteroidia bacterium]
MSIEIIPLNEQAKGAFNNGEILENKPIGFPQDGGKTKPYSNLFYWAHAYCEVDSTIGEHPHKGFEIMSFVLEGSIEHYDSKLNDWITLNKGDVQIIRAGNGITHAEKLNAGAHIFQIWFDPDIRKTLSTAASYNDYKDKDFLVDNNNGVKRTLYKGSNAPIHMVTEGVEIEKWVINPGSHTIKLNTQNTTSIYNLLNSFQVNGKTCNKHDFLIVNNENTLQIECKNELELFVICTPTAPSYPTYFSLYG